MIFAYNSVESAKSLAIFAINSFCLNAAVLSDGQDGIHQMVTALGQLGCMYGEVLCQRCAYRVVLGLDQMQPDCCTTMMPQTSQLEDVE